jgi:hypothetical protein
MRSGMFILLGSEGAALSPQQADKAVSPVFLLAALVVQTRA